MKTYLDVIEEIVAFYSENVNRRSFGNNGYCAYNGTDGKQCAFARCCETIPDDFEGKSSSQVIDIIGIDILKPEYRHLTDENFWDDLQQLHDLNRNWTDDGLSYKGEFFVKRLKNKYK